MSLTTSAEEINWKYKTLLFAEVLGCFAQVTMYLNKLFLNNMPHISTVSSFCLLFSGFKIDLLRKDCVSQTLITAHLQRHKISKGTFILLQRDGANDGPKLHVNTTNYSKSQQVITNILLCTITHLKHEKT